MDLSKSQAKGWKGEEVVISLTTGHDDQVRGRLVDYGEGWLLVLEAHGHEVLISDSAIATVRLNPTVGMGVVKSG